MQLHCMGVRRVPYGEDTEVYKSHAIEMTHLRRVEGTTRIDRVASEDIRRRLRVEIVLEVADRKKKEWRKKIEEMPQER